MLKTMVPWTTAECKNLYKKKVVIFSMFVFKAMYIKNSVLRWMDGRCHLYTILTSFGQKTLYINIGGYLNMKSK